MCTKNRAVKIRDLGVAALITAALTGCGGSDDGVTTTVKNSGVFIDSPVEGLAYVSGALSGRTDQSGGFECEAGKSVVFSIGRLNLPAVSCTKDAVVTPVKVFNASSYSEPAVANLARLLQTLDADGLPDNGIVIGQAAHDATANLPSNFSLESDTVTFEANAGAYITEVYNAGGTINNTLVSEISALAHMKSQFPLVGAWSLDGTSVRFTFFPDGSYVMTEIGAADGAGQTGMERGVYTWNPSTGAFASECPEVDTNGQWGLSHPVPDVCSGTRATMTVTGDTLTMDFGGGNYRTATRIADATKPIIGSWYMSTANNVVITFIPGSTMYLHAEDGIAGGGGQTGIEFASYTWDTITYEFITRCPNTDTNGEWGLSHPIPGGGCTGSIALVTVFDDTLEFVSQEGSFIMRRVGS